MGPSYPDNPVLYRRWRGDAVESQHRGSWVLVDTDGSALDGAGSQQQPVFARSSIKSLQALPLVESGAADRGQFDDRELALVVSSHGGEEKHTKPIEGVLARLGLSPDDLQCGTDPAAGKSSLEHNCSGKHTGFLALALHLGVDPRMYLDPFGAVQQSVFGAISETCALEEGDVLTATDGCGAPTFRLPLDKLARGMARLTNPDGLPAGRADACRRITAAATAHADLLSLHQTRVDSQLPGATGGRLYSKVGAEGVQLVGVIGAAKALAVKIDDGDIRALPRVAVALLRHLGLLNEDEVSALGAWVDDRIVNLGGREVGRHEVRPG